MMADFRDPTRPCRFFAWAREGAQPGRKPWRCSKFPNEGAMLLAYIGSYALARVRKRDAFH